MVGLMKTAVLRGFGAEKVKVEVDIVRGLPSFTLVGLAENSIKESRVRVHSAINQAGFKFPKGKIFVNLAPADIKKSGSSFDLPIALAILSANGEVDLSAIDLFAAIGELSLTGAIRPVRGMLALAESIKQQSISRLIVAPENGAEASLIKGIKVHVVSDFKDLVDAILQKDLNLLKEPEKKIISADYSPSLDMNDVVGQDEAKRALLISAAGDHNALLMGGPGSGKSMMAHRLSGILPPLTANESLMVTKIYSIAGMSLAGQLMSKRPFRAPHHSITKAGLVGGGSSFIRPGELSLACFGVLFLDELLEFPRTVLEVLRQPLEEGQITLCRASQSVTYPANINLVVALNPCPCGYYGQSNHRCRCSSLVITRYQSRLSGPLMDRMDLQVNVNPVDLKLMSGGKSGSSSAQMQAMVKKARQRQSLRQGNGRTNGNLSRRQLAQYACLSKEAETFLLKGAEKLSMSARGYDRIVKVARTVADLEDEKEIHRHHIGEAFHFRLTKDVM